MNTGGFGTLDHFKIQSGTKMVGGRVFYFEAELKNKTYRNHRYLPPTIHLQQIHYPDFQRHRVNWTYLSIYSLRYLFVPKR